MNEQLRILVMAIVVLFNQLRKGPVDLDRMPEVMLAAKRFRDMLALELNTQAANRQRMKRNE